MDYAEMALHLVRESAKRAEDHLAQAAKSETWSHALNEMDDVVAEHFQAALGELRALEEKIKETFGV